MVSFCLLHDNHLVRCRWGHLMNLTAGPDDFQRVNAGGRTQWRQVMPTRSYLSQSELPVTFGLGGSTRIESLEIIWPGGRTQQVPPPTPDQMIVVEQAK